MPAVRRIEKHGSAAPALGRTAKVERYNADRLADLEREVADLRGRIEEIEKSIYREKQS